MAQISVSSEHAESTGAHVAPIALSSLAVTTFFFGVFKADLFSTTNIIGLLLLFGGLVQLIVGIREHQAGNAVHAATFATHGGFWLALGAMLQLPGSHPSSGAEIGFFFLAWTVFSGIAFLSTMRANYAHVATFALFFLTFLALTIGAFMGGGSIFTTIGGWLGIVTGVVAAYTALTHMGSPFALPTGDH